MDAGLTESFGFLNPSFLLQSIGNFLKQGFQELVEAARRNGMVAVEPGNRALRHRAEEVAVLRAKGQSTVPSTLGLEKATNPFLRCEKADVIDAVRAKGIVGNDPVEVFTALRAWKDSF